jgi:cation diffusion facilitator family transporter
VTSTADSRLTRLAWLSIGAALITIALKALAWQLTGSVGFLSDALESVVNLVAAVLALAVLSWAAHPPDREHMYGHEKAEYLSAGVEGTLIFVAALSILWVAVGRLLHPVALQDIGIGLVVSAVAGAVNLVVAVTLIRSGRRHRSITLEADGNPLMTDVWTSAGVIAGVAAVGITGVRVLDPIIAIAVAANIVAAGVGLVRRALDGLMDHALPEADLSAIDEVLDGLTTDTVAFHAIRTRQAGRRSFVSLHVLVPGAWTVQRGHDLLEEVEAVLCKRLPHLTVFTHLEPREDPSAFADIELDRRDADSQPSEERSGTSTDAGRSRRMSEF